MKSKETTTTTDRLTRRLTRTVLLAATFTSCLIGTSAQGTQPVPVDGERLDINPMTGAQIDKLVAAVYATPPDAIAATKTAISEGAGK